MWWYNLNKKAEKVMMKMYSGEKKEQYTIEDLLAIIERLREPDGCPWDRVQTHESIKKDMIEECYEAIDALDSGDDGAFANELGDVLLQVAFHSVLADERGAFDFNTVLSEVCNKLIDRHTHVFGRDKAGNVDEALTSWEKNKKKEKGLDSYTDMLRDVPKYFPSLMRAQKLLKKAAGIGFGEKDINKLRTDAEDCMSRLFEKPENAGEIYGELLFRLTALGAGLGITPEISLAKACDTYIDRFSKIEAEAKREGKDLAGLDEEEKKRLEDNVK